jgi:hypothetical protein
VPGQSATIEGLPVDFALLILVTGVMIIRPTDVLPSIASVPVYEISILACTVVAFPRLLKQLGSLSIRGNPQVALMLSLLAFAFVADLALGLVDEAFDFAFQYAKAVVFVLLLVGILDSTWRLRTYLRSLVIIILIPTSLAILHYHGKIYIDSYERTLLNGGLAAAPAAPPAADEEAGEFGETRRLKASGFFADPNDFCEVLNPAILACLWFILARGGGKSRLLWLAPLALLAYALRLTQSRGGLLGTMAGLAVLIGGRYGIRRLLILGVLAAPLLAYLAGRQTDLGAGITQGTGQQRIQIWLDGLALMARSPILGIGTNQYMELVGKAAHNALVSAYTETGFLGGTLVFGVYFCIIGALIDELVHREPRPAGPPGDLCPLVLAIACSNFTSEMSLTHPFAVQAHMFLGLGTSYLLIARATGTPRHTWLSRGSIGLRILCASAATLIAIFAYSKLMVRY